jgi:hypothetical protein
MSTQLQSLFPSDPEQNQPAVEKKPLSRVQAYLIELKTCVILLREVLEEFKGLLVILVLLAVFILEAIHLIFK